jgi:hypothetical protein
MQLILSIYEFADARDAHQPTAEYPKPFAGDYVRGYRRTL